MSVEALFQDLPAETVRRVDEWHMWVGIDRHGNEELLIDSVRIDGDPWRLLPMMYADAAQAEAKRFRAWQIVRATTRASDGFVRPELRHFRQV